MIKEERLFEQFHPVSREKWLDKINRDLRGENFTEKLVWKTREGFGLMPFYCPEDIEDLEFIDTEPGVFPYLRGTKGKNNSWKIRQNIVVKDYKQANAKACDILQKGIDSLGFIITDPESVSEKSIHDLLKNISPDEVEVNFLSDGRARETAEFFMSHVNRIKADPNKVTGAVETDPLGRLMLNGTLCIPVEKGFDYLAGVAAFTSPLPCFRVININASHFGNAGGNIIQELAFAVSMGVEYITQLVERGFSAGEAASRIRFSFGTGSLYFPEIAKLRAARLLWSAVMNVFAPGKHESAKMEIHSVTTRWNKAINDPYVNIIRTQTEAMAAVLGGADSVTVEPFDMVFREPGLLSERIARNQQLILKEEAYFERVADPAAGSYYIENLTSLLADNAWKLFLETESEGGFLEALKKGLIQQRVNESAAKLKDEINKGEINFVGTTIYPAPDENKHEGIQDNKIYPENPDAGDVMIEPIRLFRGPSLFENRKKTKGDKE